MFEYKQCIVVTTDVKISCPKLCVQIAHASIDSYRISQKKMREEWHKEGQKKVVLSVDTTEELNNLIIKAELEHINYSLIRDMGYTEIKPDTITALGFEILPNEEIDKITKNLKILKIK
jgi:PTH2 family peptidyl-tRNA hydrolase